MDSLATELTRRGHSVTDVTSAAGSPKADHSRNYTRIRVAVLNPLEAARCALPPVRPRSCHNPEARDSPGRRCPHPRLHLPRIGHRRRALPANISADPVGAHRAGRPRPLRLPTRSNRGDGDQGTGGEVLRRAGAVITYNDRVAEQLGQLCPSVAPRTILNGVDTERFRPPDEGSDGARAELGWDDGPRVLFVGRPVAKKGFMDAWGRYRGRTPASGSSSPERRAAAARHGKWRRSGGFRGSGWPRSTGPATLSSCPRGGGISLSAQEALASGLPLVMADDPGYAPNLVGAGPGVGGGDAASSAARDRPPRRPGVAGGGAPSRAAHAREAFSWVARRQDEAMYEGLCPQRGLSRRRPRSSPSGFRRARGIRRIDRTRPRSPPWGARSSSGPTRRDGSRCRDKGWRRGNRFRARGLRGQADGRELFDATELLSTPRSEATFSPSMKRSRPPNTTPPSQISYSPPGTENVLLSLPLPPGEKVYVLGIVQPHGVRRLEPDRDRGSDPGGDQEPAGPVHPPLADFTARGIAPASRSVPSGRCRTSVPGASRRSRLRSGRCCGRARIRRRDGWSRGRGEHQQV